MSDEFLTTTTDAGIPAASDEHSLTIGPDGPILLQDHYLIQKMAYNGPRGDSSIDEGSFGNLTGEIVRAAYSKHREDDDFIQPGTMYRNVLDEEAKSRPVANIAGHATNGVDPDMQVSVIEYWRQVDGDLGARVAKAIESA
jgi:catalase